MIVNHLISLLSNENEGARALRIAHRCERYTRGACSPSRCGSSYRGTLGDWSNQNPLCFSYCDSSAPTPLLSHARSVALHGHRLNQQRKSELGREPQASQGNPKNLRRHHSSDCGGWRGQRADDAVLVRSHLFDCGHLCAVASVALLVPVGDYLD